MCLAVVLSNRIQGQEDLNWRSDSEVLKAIEAVLGMGSQVDDLKMIFGGNRMFLAAAEAAAICIHHILGVYRQRMMCLIVASPLADSVDLTPGHLRALFSSEEA